MIAFFLYFIAGWYILGLAVVAVAFYLDWEAGETATLGDLLGALAAGMMGPLLLIPLLEALGFFAQMKKSWKNRMNSPILKGRKRNVD